MSKKGPTELENLPFEEGLKRLDAIVESLEAEDVPLEKLLAQFEEGARLVKYCQARLGEAELKIQKLEQDLAGTLTVRPVMEEGDELAS